MTEAICSLRVSTTRKRSRTPWNSSSIHVMPRPGKVNAWVASHSSSVRTSAFLVVVIRFPGSGRDAIDTSLCILFNECIFHHECKRLHIDYATTDKVFIGGIPNTRHSRLSAARSAAVSCRVGPSQARNGPVVGGGGGGWGGPGRAGGGRGGVGYLVGGGKVRGGVRSARRALRRRRGWRRPAPDRCWASRGARCRTQSRHAVSTHRPSRPPARETVSPGGDFPELHRIPFLNHPCTLPASLAVHSCCLRFAFACTNDLKMESRRLHAPASHGPVLDPAEQDAFDDQPDQDDAKKAREHRPDVELVLAFVDEPTQSARA